MIIVALQRDIERYQERADRLTYIIESGAQLIWGAEWMAVINSEVISTWRLRSPRNLSSSKNDAFGRSQYTVRTHLCDGGSAIRALGGTLRKQPSQP